jgi:CRP/FNR family transcriptional regulator
MRGALTETSFPFLSRLGVEARREFGALPSNRVKAKQPLLRQGDPVDGVYLVVGGALRVYYVNAQGREATLYDVEPGGTCILALTATYNEEPYPAWVDAGPEGVSFVRVPGAAFRRLLAAEEAFRDFVFSVLSGRIFELMRTLEEAGSAQIEARVARYLLRRMDAEGVVRVTQAGIASEIGTAREVVSRALGSLGGRGVVETARQRIVVVNREALVAAAEGKNP